MMKAGVTVLFLLGVSPLLLASPVIRKLNPERRYDLVNEGGKTHVVDTWRTVDDLMESARFNPFNEISYNLFTRLNPLVSQPLIPAFPEYIGFTNFDATKRTVLLVHGWRGNVDADISTLFIPAILSQEDVNVISVDWSAGSGSINYLTAVANSYPAAQGMAAFVDLMVKTTNSHVSLFSCFGHSIGAHQCGIISRLLGKNFYYVNAMEPALPGFLTAGETVQSDDALYVEVIHTNGGASGYLTPLGQVDFYPNGGTFMPGCDNNVACSHTMSQYYVAESIVSGGFTGRRCVSYLFATQGLCTGHDLQMGGIHPKPGVAGVFYLETNAEAPYSRG